MAELPLREFEVHYTRTVHTWVRVAAKTARSASKLASERLEESELGVLCVQCTAGQIDDITIEENENSEEEIAEIEDPHEHVVLVHDFTLVEEDEDEDEDEDTTEL